MQDDLESRLSDALDREASHLPRFAGDFERVRRRGRTRQLVVRGAGGLGALVLLGATFALLSTLSDGPPETLSATEGLATPVGQPTPTPTPTPIPIESAAANTDQPQPDPTPAGFGNDEAGTAGGASLLVATGWGVGFVNPLGAQYAPVVCCEADELRWWAQPGLGGEDRRLEQGAVTVRDDLRGGLVTASRSVLFWTPSTVSGGDGGVTVLDSVRIFATAADTQAEEDADENAEADNTRPPAQSSRIDLWDVAQVDGNVQVLYSIVTSGDGGPQNRTATLFSLTLGDPDTVPKPRALEGDAWPSNDDDWYTYEGASWLPDGGWMTLKSFDERACSWIDLTSADNRDSSLVSPLPQPGDIRDCPYRPAAAAATNDAGTLVAVSQGYREPNAQLVVYSLVDGTETMSRDLPATQELQGAWTEIDFASSAVLLSRGTGMEDSQWPSLDETVLATIDPQTAALSPVPFYGAPSFPRALVPTSGSTALDLSSPLWFGSTTDAAPVETEPDPADDPSTTPTPAAQPTPEPTTEPTPEPTAEPVDPRRTPTGRQERIIDSGQLAGDDACVTFAGFFTCVGAGYQTAVADADRILGANTSSNGERQSEDPLSAQTIWLLDNAQFTLVNDADSVAQIRISPTTDASPPETFAGTLTIDDVLTALGPPAEISNTIGEGSHALWLQYYTTAGFIWYGFTDVGTDDGLLLSAGDITIPDSYLSLPINSYRAQPAG